jgi:hypothetical protein
VAKIDQHSAIPIKRKIGNKMYVLEGTYNEKMIHLGDLWDKVQSLKKSGYDIKPEEKIQGIGKRKPIMVTLLWIRKGK